MSRFLAQARTRRALAGLLTATLPTALLLATSPAARADTQAVDGQTLTWKVSQQFVDHFAKASYNQNTFVASDGAALAQDRSTVFGDGSGWVNAAGDASVQYTGKVTGSFVVGAPQYSVSIADPAVTVKDGKGQITADVSWTVPSDTTSPSGSTDDVVVTTFDAGSSNWTDDALTATPDWADVLPADSTAATGLGIKAGQPVDGGSFAPQFLTALNPGLRPHFYASGAGSDAKKPPAAFTATVAPPATATATVTHASPASVKINVKGQGYATSGVGIYVGLTEAGPVNTADASKYRATVWLTSSQLNSDGSFDATIELSPTDIGTLDRTKTYEVHTQKAHGQSAGDPSQNVRMPVALDIPALQQVTTKTIGTPVTTSYSAKGAQVTASVPGATGKVQMALNGTTKTAWLKDGKASFAVPSTLTAKIYTAKLSYLGQGDFAPSSASTRVTVRSTKTQTATSVTTTPRTTKSGKLAIKVTNTATNTSPAPKGTVKVTLTRAGRSVSITRSLQYGKVNPTVQKLSKGTWKATVTYSGESTKFVRSTTTVNVKVTT